MNQNIYVLIEHQQNHINEISYIMLAAAKYLAEHSNGDVVPVILGSDVQDLTTDLLGSQVLYFDHPQLADFNSEAYRRILKALLQDDPPRAFIMGHTTIGMDLICDLATQLSLPVISQCQGFDIRDGDLQFRSQICGGKVMVNGHLPESAVLISLIPGGYKADQGKLERPPQVKVVKPDLEEDLQINLAGYIEPDTSDIDISKQDILVGVGRGLSSINDFEIIEELAESLGGTVCASRPVVDMGWLPTTRLVGKSGKSIKPKLYLALGISGAPEHIEGAVDSEMIIAVNTDINAPIYDFAQYGIDMDMLDFAEALIENLSTASIRT